VLVKPNSITYDAATSNITAKSDLGPYTLTYGGQQANGFPIGPHALSAISGVPTSFPQAEPNYPTALLNVTYTDFKKIATLSEKNKYYTLMYGVDDQRRMSVYSEGGVTLTRYYLGDYEEEVNSLGKVRKIHYLSGAILIQNDGQPDSLLYTYSDFQGSLIVLTDASGNLLTKTINGAVVEIGRFAYDPWGARRNPTDWTQKDLRTKWITSRGYTLHEHLDAFGIINMNGRVYDPQTAMFFSPDPFVQAPDNWVNYNRYGYCLNNPLIYSDPSGYMFDAKSQSGYEEQFWQYLGSGCSYSQAISASQGGGGGGGGSSMSGSYQYDMYLEASDRGFEGNYNEFITAYNRQSHMSNFNGDFKFGVQYGYDPKYSASGESITVENSELDRVYIVSEMITIKIRDFIKWDYLGSDKNNLTSYDKLNISTYWMGTIASLVPVVLKSPGTAKAVTETLLVATKFTSEKLFGVGVVFSFIDMRNNNYSTNSVLWAVADTGMGIIGFVPGGQLIAGLYFTGRIAYQVYDEIKKTN
jgi:RHS repeat-associated protein